LHADTWATAMVHDYKMIFVLELAKAPSRQKNQAESRLLNSDSSLAGWPGLDGSFLKPALFAGSLAVIQRNILRAYA